MRRMRRRELQSTPPSRLTISRLRDEFNNDGTVKNINNGRSETHRSATNGNNVQNVEHL